MGERTGGVGRRSAIWVVGCLAVLTCSAGVAAAVTSSGGGSDPHRAAAAAATPTTAVTLEQTTTSTAPAPASTLPATTTTVPVTRSTTVITTATVASVGAVVGHMAHEGHSIAGAGVAMIGPAGERDAVSDEAGDYRFDDVPPGQYEMYVSAESVAAPCNPGAPCVGSAIAMERRPVTVRAGKTLTEDWEYPFDSVPTTTTTSPR